MTECADGKRTMSELLRKVHKAPKQSHKVKVDQKYVDTKYGGKDEKGKDKHVNVTYVPVSFSLTCSLCHKSIDFNNNLLAKDASNTKHVVKLRKDWAKSNLEKVEAGEKQLCLGDWYRWEKNETSEVMDDAGEDVPDGRLEEQASLKEEENEQ